MSSSQPSSSGSQPGKDPATIAIDAELADRLVAALELIGTAYQPDGRQDQRRGSAGTPDPVRVRTARDYDVLRGLLGRAGAPRPLRMHREKSGGGPKSPKGPKIQNSAGDNAIVVDDPIPASARDAVVESPGGGSGPLRELFDVSGGSTPRLELTEITSSMPISRVEIFDLDGNLVAFGPSAAPIA
jgi:hypothetical protein